MKKIILGIVAVAVAFVVVGSVGFLILNKEGSAPVSGIPNIEQPEGKVTSNDCELACVNYVNKCLALVPNADQALFNEGLSSCIGECASYSESKVNCLISAIDCPAMTEQCGL